jgi:hypothetical protein
MTSVPTFHTTLLQFLGDLEGTFPEWKSALDSLSARPAGDVEREFRSLWKDRLTAIATRDESLFATPVEILPGITMKPTLWNEVTDKTHTAIWNYLSSLTLLVATSEEGGFWSEQEFQKGMDAMMDGLKAAMGEGGDNPFGAMGGLFEKLKGMAGMAAAAGGAGGLPEFKLPERMFKGHIAKMAKELAEEFKPEDFGIPAEMAESNDPSKIFEFLQEVFTKNPEKLMTAAKRIAKKIQTKFQRGEIRREEILAEIEELMKEFSENEAFSSIFGQMGDLLQGSAKASGNEGSERRRAVQERLRKKTAEKEAKKNSIVIRSDASAIAAAEAAAAALLAEENSSKKGKKSAR